MGFYPTPHDDDMTREKYMRQMTNNEPINYYADRGKLNVVTSDFDVIFDRLLAKYYPGMPLEMLEIKAKQELMKVAVSLLNKVY